MLYVCQVIPEDTFTNTFGVNGWSYMLNVKVLIMVYLNSAANPVIYYTRFESNIVFLSLVKSCPISFVNPNPGQSNTRRS